jgi:acetyl esterase/lipase
MEEEWRDLPLPDGLVMVYPSLDLNIGSWMNDDQMKLIRQRDMRKTNRNVVRRKSEYFERASGIVRPHKNSDEEDEEESESEPNMKNIGSLSINDRNVVGKAAAAIVSGKSRPLSTRLAMTSRLSYFNDRLLTPEMMRAMVILYIGPHNRPDFTTDFFLSPIVAPGDLLARFPKTYFLTGERDPLVDDTVIFAGRIRQAKQAVWRHRRELGLEPGNPRPEEGVEVSLIPGISHGFLQMTALYPEARREISKCARWLNEILADRPDHDDDGDCGSEGEMTEGWGGRGRRKRNHQRNFTGGSTTSNDEERPLEMSMSASRGGGQGHSSRGRGKRMGSNASLGSEVDLVGRRMQGLVGGLTAGFEDEDDQ